MYYPDEVIDEVRSRSDIVDVISAHVKLQKKGSSWFGLCPFHNERTPSFSVSPNKQIYYCFGCGRGGDVFRFVMEYENYSFQEAVKMLAERAGITLPQREETPEEKRNTDLRKLLLDINRAAGGFYYYQLRTKAGETGLAYLKGRGLTEETIRSFGLGYAGKYSSGLYRFLKSKGYSDELLAQSGLVTFDEKRGAYDKFFNRVMFPIMDVNRRIIGFGGRVMGDGMPKYLNSPETKIFEKSRNLYGLHEARRTREKYLIVCEGYMDVIAMHQAGFTNAVASLGTALTEQHCALLRRYTDQVILSYDSDGAGVRAALRAIPMLRSAGITARILQLKPCKDPDEFIRSQGSEAFRERLEQAGNSFMFEVSVLQQQYNMSDPEAKTAFYRAIAEKIAAFSQEVERDNYIDAVCDAYHISRDGMHRMVYQYLKSGWNAAPEKPQRRPTRQDEGLVRSEALLLSWLSDYPSLFPVMKQYLQPEDFSTGLHREIARLVYEQLEAGQLRPAVILEHFTDPESQDQAARIFHTTITVDKPEEQVKAIRETIKKVLEAALRRKDEGIDSLDMEGLQELIRRKKQADTLEKAVIRLEDHQQ